MNYPTLSFKDRVVSVALSRARELGFKVVACASTGNLANSVAANAAAAGLKSYVSSPPTSSKARSRLARLRHERHWHPRPLRSGEPALLRDRRQVRWAFVNVNMRPYYAEGSKSMGFEIAEQLGWRSRGTPCADGLGSLLTKITKLQEFIQPAPRGAPFSIHGAQASGCSPIPTHKKGMDIVKPVPKPDTIVKSLAIGTPADGYYAIHAMKETGGSAEDVTDDEVARASAARGAKGIFAETAGGVTVACAKKLIAAARFRATKAWCLHYRPWPQDPGSHPARCGEPRRSSRACASLKR